MKKPNKSIYTIVAIAPDNIQKTLKDLKDKFDLPYSNSNSKTKLILKDTAHFAIKRTFYLKNEIKEEDIINELKKIKDYKPITVNCLESNLFTNTSYGDILFAKIEKNMNLRDLHNEIVEKLDKKVITKNVEMERENYLPHISIVYNIPKEKTPNVKSDFDSKIIPFNFIFNKLFLLKDYNIEKDEREIIYVHEL